MTVAEVRRRLESNRRLRAWVDAQTVELTARLNEMLSDASVPADRSTERELVAFAGLSSREAATVVARTHTVADIPALGEVLAAGSTTSGHVDAVTRGLTIAGGDRDRFLEMAPSLVEAATRMPVAEFASLVRDVARSVASDGGLSTFERQRRSTYLKTWLDTDGMLQLRGAFDPESAAVLHGTISREVERLYHSGDDGHPMNPMPWITPNEHRAAHALTNIARATTSTSGTASTGSARAEVIVHIDLATLTTAYGSAPHTMLGTDIPVETARRIACDADIIPVVLNGDSVPIDVGRAKRLATANQRRALEAVHRTCAIPDCDTPYHHCQIHHIDYWENGGSTDLNNMVPLCTQHHHAAHEGRWTLTVDPHTRHVTFTPPRRLE